MAEKYALDNYETPFLHGPTTELPAADNTAVADRPEESSLRQLYAIDPETLEIESLLHETLLRFDAVETLLDYCRPTAMHPHEFITLAQCDQMFGSLAREFARGIAMMSTVESYASSPHNPVTTNDLHDILSGLESIVADLARLTRED